MHITHNIYRAIVRVSRSSKQRYRSICQEKNMLIFTDPMVSEERFGMVSLEIIVCVYLHFICLSTLLAFKYHSFLKDWGVADSFQVWVFM